MNQELISPDKLMAYLEGKLSDREAYAFEEILLQKDSALGVALAQWQEGDEWKKTVLQMDLKLEEALLEQAEESEDTFAGEASFPSLFELEEEILQEDFNINNLDRLERQSEQLDAVFQDALSGSTESKKVALTVTPVRWWEKAIWAAAACSTFLLIGFFFMNKPEEKTYYVLGEQEQINKEYQEVVNTRNLFLNKFNRLMRFGKAVPEQQLAGFQQEVLTLCAPNSILHLPNQQEPILLKDYLTNPALWLPDYQIGHIHLEEQAPWGLLSRSQSFEASGDTLQTRKVVWEWGTDYSGTLVTALYFENGELAH